MGDERLLPPGMEALPERRCMCGKHVYKGRRIYEANGSQHGQTVCVEMEIYR